MKTYIVILASGERFEVEASYMESFSGGIFCILNAHKDIKCNIPSTAFVFEKGQVKEQFEKPKYFTRYDGKKVYKNPEDDGKKYFKNDEEEMLWRIKMLMASELNHLRLLMSDEEYKKVSGILSEMKRILGYEHWVDIKDIGKQEYVNDK